ncbi:hypothetical protein [Sulfurimonas sp.]|uniref:hypothetical protein n=1 Tax=Sulfurimonas sp. TaxID=2022749 RepID=UPI0025F1D267|nr:hypothetical protein [Sulfurimonas sp.]
MIRIVQKRYKISSGIRNFVVSPLVVETPNIEIEIIECGLYKFIIENDSIKKVLT